MYSEDYEVGTKYKNIKLFQEVKMNELDFIINLLNHTEQSYRYEKVSETEKILFWNENKFVFQNNICIRIE